MSFENLTHVFLRCGDGEPQARLWMRSFVEQCRAERRHARAREIASRLRQMRRSKP
ncbi:MAG TPA: hypothetical protein P5137_04380 [Candidatus Brocadiia bacterium]|nr:hypothetical protein [Candidatus Brocadiia bacterium]